jgi:hypothetical protein
MKNYIQSGKRDVDRRFYFTGYEGRKEMNPGPHIKAVVDLWLKYRKVSRNMPDNGRRFTFC